VIEPAPGQLCSDAGLLPIRQFDESIGLTQTFADALDDPRDPDLTCADNDQFVMLSLRPGNVHAALGGR
jgi:hypothetical protein